MGGVTGEAARAHAGPAVASLEGAEHALDGGTERGKGAVAGGLGRVSGRLGWPRMIPSMTPRSASAWCRSAP